MLDRSLNYAESPLPLPLQLGDLYFIKKLLK